MTLETFGRTIQLFLVDGTPAGLRKATIHGWTGLTFVATGTTFAALTARPELDRTGIYILSGPDVEAVGGTRAYIRSDDFLRRQQSGTTYRHRRYRDMFGLRHARRASSSMHQN